MTTSYLLLNRPDYEVKIMFLVALKQTMQSFNDYLSSGTLEIHSKRIGIVVFSRVIENRAR